MIGPTGAVKVLVATKPVDFRKGAEGLAALVRAQIGADPFGGTIFVFRAKRGQLPTFCMGFRFATIAYRWHPLFGRTLQVSPFRRGKDLTCIYTNERPGLCRELPNWMFDETYCSGMTIGQSAISIEGLNELAAVLGLLGANRNRWEPTASRSRKRSSPE